MLVERLMTCLYKDVPYTSSYTSIVTVKFLSRREYHLAPDSERTKFYRLTYVWRANIIFGIFMWISHEDSVIVLFLYWLCSWLVIHNTMFRNMTVKL